MAILADYHLHSSFSGDSEAPMESMILRGIELGLTQMCFTEHMDFDFPTGEFDFLVDMPAYRDKLMELKKKYEDKIEIYFGMELGL